MTDPNDITWFPATVANAGASSSTWSLTLPPLEGVYEIMVRATDQSGNTTPGLGEMVAFAGLIDSAPPQIDLQVRYEGVSMASKTLYQIEVQDLHLDIDSIVFLDIILHSAPDVFDRFGVPVFEAIEITVAVADKFRL